jgi:cephalosporin hydroxylase
MNDRELALEAVRREAFQKVSELAPLIAVVRERQPRTVVEIGTHKGGTLFAWCQAAHPEALIVSIDLPDGLFGGGYSKEEAREFQSFAQPGQELHALRRDSHKRRTLRRLKSLLRGRPIEFLLIDGDHTYEGVRRDWEMYGPLVAPNGLIAFHDIQEHTRAPLCKVDELWAELAPHHRTAEFVDPGDDRGLGQWGGIGVIFKEAEGQATRST